MEPMPAVNLKYRKDLFGVGVDAVNYTIAIKDVSAAMIENQPYIYTALAVHGLMTAVNDKKYRDILQDCRLVLPDGQPVRVALNYFYGTSLNDRVYGPALMDHLCQWAASNKKSIYLYGSEAKVNNQLKLQLQKKNPKLIIAGHSPSDFRELKEEQFKKLAEKISESKPNLLFIGLGCPRQEILAWQLKRYLDFPIVCVGAAFDFLSGNKPMAPNWMQKNALEWLFRFYHEPIRLGPRYVKTNTEFIAKFLQNAIIKKFGRGAGT